MKIFRISPAPGNTLQFRKLHNLRTKPFADQIEILRAENLLLPGGFAASMQAEGFEVFETLYNDWGLQGRWAFENNIEHMILQPNWQFRIIYEQVKLFQPDVIFVYAGALFWLPRHNRDLLRRACNRPVIITGFWGDELPAGESYREYFGDLDYAFCSSSVYEGHMASAGIPASTIGNPFDDTIAYSKTTVKRHNFIFCGTTGFGYPDHIGRYEKLKEIMSKSDLKVWAKEPKSASTKMLENFVNLLIMLPGLALRVLAALSPPRVKRAVNYAFLLKQVELDASTIFRNDKNDKARYFDNLKPLTKLFRGRIKAPLINGSDYYTLIANSKIVLNLHRDEDADIGNIRCFEATGLGSCLITDRGEELREFFDVENDIVTFNTIEECLSKVRHLLDHPAELKRISENGQRATLARHTIEHRCRAIAGKLRELLTEASNPEQVKSRRRRIVLATYDFENHPVSYDFAFFLQAAEIYRKISRCDELLVSIVHPFDMENMPGVSKAANAAVDAHSRNFRVFHICTQMVELMRTAGVLNLKDRSIQKLLNNDSDLELVRFPGPEADHHSWYSRLINDNPDLVTGFSASIEARRYVKAWLDPIQEGRKILCVTLRQYKFDPERNTDMKAWQSFLGQIDPSKFMVVVVPDTDHLADFKSSLLGAYPCYEPACFDVDLRFALYEAAFLNMFVNNGPGAAAMLNKNVNYLMFKVLVPSVPHCTEEFLKWNGYVIGTTPKYATPFQKWVWQDDTEQALWSEFCVMRDKILGSKP